jgi:hypothetical protein
VLVVTEWEVWRQDDGGVRERLSVQHDRIEALATVLALDTDSASGWSCWSAGPPGPVCATNRDLYTRLVQVGNDMNAAGRSLSEFLRSWWSVSRTLAAQARLDLDRVAAMVTAAATIDPPALSPAWRTTSRGFTPEPTSYVDWEQIVLSQIADLADLADAGPLDAYACFGIDIPRLTDVVRATGSRWYNFDPGGYLECGMAGSLGGWDEADGLRVAVPGPVISNAVGAQNWATGCDLGFSFGAQIRSGSGRVRVRGFATGLSDLHPGPRRPCPAPPLGRLQGR